MKKRFVISFLAFPLLFAGCKGPSYTSKGAYLGSLHEVELAMAGLGLYPVGTGQETVNEPYVFDDEWKNDWVTYETRSFADSAGNTATFTVKYRSKYDGVSDVEVSGCEVSRSDYYQAVCGDDGVVRRAGRQVQDRNAPDNYTTAAVVLVGSGLLIPVCIALLMLL